MRRADVVIVGTGHAGAQAAIALRQQGFAGSILIIGRDIEPPYERPALSKEYLAGEKPFERMYIRPPSFWADKRVDLLLGHAVTTVDAEGKTITLSTDAKIAYGELVWATGGDPRRLTVPGADLGGIHTVRDRADVDRIIAGLEAGARKVVVIGGGYIGLEAAAVLAKLGCTVTLLEALPRVLARVAGEDLSRFYENEHRGHGVDIRLDADVAQIEGESGQVAGVRLASGELLACAMVVVGIGISPSVAPLVAAGARASNGVEVDACCRTSLAGIYAIGDCAAHANPFAGGSLIRLESVQNANDMAMTAARSICGNAEPYRAVPWFWSNQFDLKLQTIGLSAGFDAVVLRGSPAQKSFSLVYLREGRVIALDCVNAVKDYVQGRKLVEAGSQVPASDLAQSEIPLKDLAAAQ